MKPVGYAYSDDGAQSLGKDVDGQAVFEANCETCHSGFLGSRAPSPQVLGTFPPDSILHALTTGVMRVQGYSLSGAERRAVAEYLTKQSFGSTLREASRGHCSQAAEMGDPAAGPRWNGWGNGIVNHSFQSTEHARLRAESVPELELEWAFGFPDAYSAWAQPVVAGGRLFVGSQAGVFYSLDAVTGCTYWSFEARAGIRSAASVAPLASANRVDGEGSPRYAVYFGDMSGRAYALDAENGDVLWSKDLADHEKSRITGSPLLHGDRLFVPMSSWVTVDENGDRCCTFRGSVSAVNAATGRVIWKGYTIPEQPRPLGKVSSNGTALWGPSGSAVWSSPTIDEKRGVVYVGTGNSYTEPAVNSDSVIAFDVATGDIVWSKQLTPDDVWLDGCSEGESDCVYDRGPNADFGSAPMLVNISAERDLLIIGQKSGVAYAIDPDRQGAIVWQYRAGDGGPAGGIVWGSAVDGRNAYFPVSDLAAPEPGGLHAVDLRTGKRAWFAPPPPLLCGTLRYGCSPAQPVGLAVIPGVVFAGAVDGGFRAFSTATGELLWQFDTNRNFETVNGVAANGGSLIGAGPTVVGGMVYVNSGYGTNGGRVGNVLLAFSANLRVESRVSGPGDIIQIVKSRSP